MNPQAAAQTHRDTAEEDRIAAEENASQLEAAFGPDMYAKYLVSKDLPLQCMEEDYAAARRSALLERRVEDAKAFKEQRANFAYKSSGMSATDMRTQLVDLLPQINARYRDLVDADDDVSCKICIEHEEKIRGMLIDYLLNRCSLF